MKKLLLTLIFLLAVSIPVFADGSYIDSTYQYSITYKSLSTSTVIIKSLNPIFVDNDKKIYIKGDYKTIVVNGTSILEGFNTSQTDSYVVLTTPYVEILESSTDIININSKQIVYQSEQTDNVVISNAVVDEFRGYSQKSNSLLLSIYVFISFAITICAGGFVIYFVLKPLYYFIR